MPIWAAFSGGAEKDTKKRSNDVCECMIACLDHAVGRAYRALRRDMCVLTVETHHKILNGRYKIG